MKAKRWIKRRGEGKDRYYNMERVVNLKLCFRLKISKLKKWCLRKNMRGDMEKMKESEKISLNFNKKEEKRNYLNCFGCDYYSFNHIGRNKYKPSNWK